MQGSSGKGRSIVKSMDDLLKIAAQSSTSSGGGGDPSGSGSSGGGEGKDRSAKKDQEEKKDPLKDNKKAGDGDPEKGEHVKDPPKKPVDPPKSDRQKPKPQDMKGVFLARLPDKVREAVLNGDFDQVPEKYRELVREWTKALSEKDAEEEGGK